MKPKTRERFIPDYLIGIVGKNVLKAHAASEKGPKELAEVKARLELAEQLRPEETTQKQALQEAFEKEKNKLLDEIATLQKRAKCAENRADKVAKWSEFKCHAKELKARAMSFLQDDFDRGLLSIVVKLNNYDNFSFDTSFTKILKRFRNLN